MEDGSHLVDDDDDFYNRCHILEWLTMRLLQDVQNQSQEQPSWFLEDKRLSTRVQNLGQSLGGHPSETYLHTVIKVYRILYHMHNKGPLVDEDNTAAFDDDDLIWLWTKHDKLYQLYCSISIGNKTASPTEYCFPRCWDAIASHCHTMDDDTLWTILGAEAQGTQVTRPLDFTVSTLLAFHHGVVSG
jgi:hypothetical protein